MEERNLKEEFYTRREFCSLCGIANQNISYHIANKNIDTFEKDGKIYIYNNEKNNTFIKFYKNKNK
jgi:hypothetical protein